MGERSGALDASDPIRTLVDRLAVADAPCALRLPGGSAIAVGDGPPRFTIVLGSDAALARLATQPSMLAVGEAFVDGTLDVEGDLLAAVALAYRVAGDAPAPMPLRIAPARRDVAAHYELPSEFYALFLDRHMLYTCAYYPRPDATLDEAQDAKLALVCRKLALAPDERLLDVGCGWGGLVVWAAGRHGLRAEGVTLSAEQAAWAARWIEREGVGAHAAVVQRDFYDVAADGAWDKIVSLGVIEHMGVGSYPAYFARVRSLLRPGGLFLNQGITHRTTSPRTSGMAFLDRYVFPGGDLATIEHTVAEMERSGLEILHVEAIGRHYGPTLREWLARLTARRDGAVALVGERTFRIYACYLAAAAVAFEAGWIDVHHVLARRP